MCGEALAVAQASFFFLSVYERERKAIKGVIAWGAWVTVTGARTDRRAASVELGALWE